MMLVLQKSLQKCGLLQDSFATQISAQTRGFQSFAKFRTIAMHGFGGARTPTRRRRPPAPIELYPSTRGHVGAGYNLEKWARCSTIGSSRRSASMAFEIDPLIASFAGPSPGAAS